MSMLQSLRYITWSTLCVALAVTGCAEISKKAGVENRWRDQHIMLLEGETTQQQVLAQLGPPSQIIALSAKTVFYYLFEETKGRLLFLVLYNQADTNVTYDRAIFFFNKDGILETYAFSKKENG
jgi:outer membrane protein assembly factor BamE (lipoprotein component of BamABCDE complex)